MKVKGPHPVLPPKSLESMLYRQFKKEQLKRADYTLLVTLMTLAQTLCVKHGDCIIFKTKELDIIANLGTLVALHLWSAARKYLCNAMTSLC